MRTVKHTGPFGATNPDGMASRLDAELLETGAMLVKDEALPRRYFGHALGGEWSDHRNCHIKPELILVCRKPDETSLSSSAAARTAAFRIDKFRHKC